jgi:hypothetical protein
VTLAHEQIPRVGRDRERLALQTEMGRVHGVRILCGALPPGAGFPPPGTALCAGPGGRAAIRSSMRGRGAAP